MSNVTIIHYSYIQPHVDLNVRNNRTHTPLHCAVIGGYGAIIEALVGYGADVNAADLEDNTALHILLIKKAAKPVSEELAPHIAKVSVQRSTLCTCWLWSLGCLNTELQLERVSKQEREREIERSGGQ